jgi:pimeloyl-ACP methyl ester carboxylesterase
MKNNVSLLIVFLATLFFTCLVSCEKMQMADFELTEEPISFQYKEHRLKGVLSKPKNKDSYPIVIFVHGDGAADRYQKGYYKYIWQQLNQAGIACLSWDKQGVGESSGNWLNQTMDDRAAEVQAAIHFLNQRPDIEEISLWGISQGGWVIPKVAQLAPEIRSLIFHSPAINWLRQGKYHSRKRLKREGYTSEQIDQGLEYHDHVTTFLHQDNYTAYQNHYDQQTDFIKEAFSLMSKERWHFAVKNHKTDITEDLNNIDLPILALFGAADVHVDAQESKSVFDEIFSQKTAYKSYLFTDADHILFDNHKKGKADTKEDIWYKLLYKGENVFAAGMLEAVSDFLKE